MKIVISCNPSEKLIAKAMRSFAQAYLPEAEIEIQIRKGDDSNG